MVPVLRPSVPHRGPSRFKGAQRGKVSRPDRDVSKRGRILSDGSGSTGGVVRIGGGALLAIMAKGFGWLGF